MQALDQAPVRKLLTRFATKAQKAGGGSCALKIDDKSFPLVFAASTGEDADFYWSLLKEAAAQCGVSVVLKPTKGLVAEYERSPKLQVLDVDLPRMLELLGVAPLVPSYRSEWKDALVAGLDAPAAVIDALAGFTFKVDGRSLAEVVQALNRVRELKGQPLRLREVSSHAFWGSSKELDDRAEMVAKLLELAECPFALPPLHLAVRLPTGRLKGVLFVENKTTFDILKLPETAELALVYSAGFMASARRLTNRADVAVYFAEGGGPDTTNAELVQEFLFEASTLPGYFFGDLDYSGMAILKAMRQNFPALRAWQPGYQRLLNRLQAGDGHSPAAARKEGQRDPVETGCELADQVLLPAMRGAGLFVDQE